jgi:hypothetical protein
MSKQMMKTLKIIKTFSAEGCGEAILDYETKKIRTHFYKLLTIRDV